MYRLDTYEIYSLNERVVYTAYWTRRFFSFSIPLFLISFFTVFQICSHKKLCFCFCCYAFRLFVCFVQCVYFYLLCCYCILFVSFVCFLVCIFVFPCVCLFCVFFVYLCVLVIVLALFMLFLCYFICYVLLSSSIFAHHQFAVDLLTRYYYYYYYYYYYHCYFLSEFSLTNIHESQDCRGRRRAFLLAPHYHLHPLHRHLDINRAIAAESSHLHIASSRTRTGNLWFPSASR